MQVNSFEQNACAFLKEVVKANKMLQRVQQAAEGIKGNVTVQVIIKKARSLRKLNLLLRQFFILIYIDSNTNNLLLKRKRDPWEVSLITIWKWIFKMLLMMAFLATNNVSSSKTHRNVVRVIYIICDTPGKGDGGWVGVDKVSLNSDYNAFGGKKSSLRAR